MQTDKVWSRLIAAVEFGVRSRPAAIAMNDKRVRLALELYSDSYFETSNSARFLGFVTVLEVLKDRRSASEAAQGLVKQWKVQADSLLDADEAASVRGSLDWLRSISISRAIASVVIRHLGDDRASEAKALYVMRSKLVHDGEHPADAAGAMRQAEKVTKELLAHILTSGTL
jgi:hypothetical protein